MRTTLKAVLALCLFVLIATSSWAITVTVGSGTTTTTVLPIRTRGYYNYSQQIYTQAQINHAGAIRSISFYFASGDNNNCSPWDVYLGHTTKSSFSSTTDWVPEVLLTRVYSGAVTFSNNNWMTVTFTTPFQYNNSDNLVVAIDENNSGQAGFWIFGSEGNFRSFPSGTNTGLYVNQSADIDPVNPPTGTRTGTLSQIRFDLSLIADPTNVTAVPASVSQIDLSWMRNATPDNVMVTFTADNTFGTPVDGTSYSVNGEIAGGGRVIYKDDGTSFSHTGRSANTTYYYKLWSLGNDGSYSPAYSGGVKNSARTTMLSFPASRPRWVAQWGLAEAAIVSYSGEFGLPLTMIKELYDDVDSAFKLYVIRPSGSAGACNTALSNAGMDTSRIKFITAPVDSYWVRDYGPWTVFDGDNVMSVVDFTYNRPRPNDDASTAVVATTLGLPRYVMDITATGGNKISDGYGIMMSTNLILDDNPQYTEPQLDWLFHNFTGINDYHKYVEPLSYSTHDHADCWVKLLDVDKVMIARVAPGTQAHASLEAAVAVWQSRTSSYGTPYRIYRVDVDRELPYTNCFTFNKKIYVPLMPNETTANNAALAAYAAAMPGYTIKGYLATGADPWLSTDAIHCRVNTVHDKNMLFVHHIPVHEAIENDFVTITADIAIPTGVSVVTADTYVSYRSCVGTVCTGWITVPLINTSGNIWSAEIPTPPLGSTLEYTIHAKDNNGEEYDRSLCGRLDPFVIITKKDDTLPVELSSFTAALSIDNFVNIQWITQSETGVMGFYVLRNTEDDLSTALMVSNLIEATNTSQQQVYIYKDTDITQPGTYYYWLQNSDLDGEICFNGPISIVFAPHEGGTTPIPVITELKAIYPNPFNPEATISYSLAKAENVDFVIYNNRGQIVKQIKEGYKGMGSYRLRWNGTDNQGRACATGVYYIRMHAGKDSFTSKAVLLK